MTSSTHSAPEAATATIAMALERSRADAPYQLAALFLHFCFYGSYAQKQTRQCVTVRCLQTSDFAA